VLSRPPVYAIEWRAASKRYGSRPALDALDLAIPVGSSWGLLGPNGAGKTTALRLALGFARASAGEVALQGLPPADPRARIGLGLLPERLALPARATPTQWLALHADLCGIARGDSPAAIGAALERTGIADRARDPIASLSKGLRQRLGFATALLGAPALLVLDEPGSGLDPLGIRDARGWIEAERARGATVLVCSHQLSEVERTCDHVAILDRGRVAASGALRDLVGAGETLEDVFVRAVRA
jgi:ABC-2 type transport system ATP-binding protein